MLLRRLKYWPGESFNNFERIRLWPILLESAVSALYKTPLVALFQVRSRVYAVLASDATALFVDPVNDGTGHTNGAMASVAKATPKVLVYLVWLLVFFLLRWTQFLVLCLLTFDYP